MRNRTLLQKKLASSKLSLLVTTFIATALDVILLILMVINGYDFYYVKCTLVLAIFNIAFAFVVWFSNFRFKYTIPYIVLYILVSAVVIWNQVGIYYPSDSIRIATDTISIIWVISHCAVILSVIFASLVSRNSFKPSSLIFSCVHIGIIGIICFTELVLVFVNGVFGHGAGAKTIVYTENYDGTLCVDSVLVDNNDTIIVPYEYNGQRVTSFNSSIFMRNDVNHYVFNTKDTVLKFNQLEYSFGFRTDITGEANEASVQYLKELFYDYPNMISFANSIVPNDLDDDKVYVNFTYDQKSLELYGKPLDIWIRDKGTTFSLSDYSNYYPYFENYNQNSTEDLLWSLNNTDGYILNPVSIDNIQINESINNCSLNLEKIHKIKFEYDNDDLYEISDEYKYSYSSTGAKEPYLYCTKSTVNEKLYSIPEREGFELELFNGSHLITKDDVNTLLMLNSENIFNISPKWHIKKLNEISISKSQNKVQYGDTITLSVDHEELGQDFNYSYTWTNASGEVVGYDKILTTNALTPSPNGSQYFVAITITSPSSSLVTVSNDVTSVTVTKKVIKPTWIVEDYVYDGTPKQISVIFDNDQIVEGDNPFDFNLVGDIKYGDYASKIDSGNYDFSIQLGGSLIHKYEIPEELKTNKLVIKKREITPVWDTNEFTYNGNNQRPLVIDFENIIEDELTEVLANLVYSGNAVAAGKHKVSINLSMRNYQINQKSKEYNYTILPKAITAVWETATNGSDISYVYNGELQHPKIVEFVGTINESYTDLLSVVSYNGQESDYSENSYTCTAILPENINYTISNESKNCKYYITKYKIDRINWSENTIVYDGTNQEHKITATYRDVNGNDVNLGISFSDSFVNAGTYIATAILNDSNYSLPDVYTKEYVIEKEINSIIADFEIVDWTVGNTPSVPNLPISKYGTPIVTYYSDDNLTIEVLEFTSSTPAGKYYVVVVTPEGDNYTSVTKVYSFIIGEGNE